jgi:hypothetical protein
MRGKPSLLAINQKKKTISVIRDQLKHKKTLKTLPEADGCEESNEKMEIFLRTNNTSKKDIIHKIQDLFNIKSISLPKISKFLDCKIK